MARGRTVASLLKPLDSEPVQYYLGTGLHTLGLIGWILDQTGKADVYVSTFSTSDAFLSGFLRLKKRNKVAHSVLLADLKASRKTVSLYRLMQNCFDDVYLSMNHSKIVLIKNDRYTVSVISSQNQTYGDRAECTMVTTDQNAFLSIYSGFSDIVNKNSIHLNGLFGKITERHREAGGGDDDTVGGVLPFGY